MQKYLQLLANRHYAILWLGATISILGDALTWTALVWLVYEMTGSTTGIGLLIFIYTAPVFVGGFCAGIVLDRFDRRTALIADNAIRGAFVGAIPILFHLGRLELWHLYLAAGAYGLFKMISLAGLPSILPTIVPPEQLTTANAMESISWGVGGIVGPALGGVLIGVIGGANAIALDALSYFVFVACLATLPSLAIHSARGAGVGNVSLAPALRFIRATPAIWFITLMFICFNVGTGIFMVALPVYAKEILRGDATTFGFLLSATTVGGLLGALIIGGMNWRWTLGRSIAAAQFIVGASLLGLVALPGFALTLAILGVAHILEPPLTIWAQTIRMRLIPADLRGRVFSILRTIMQSAPPLGGMLGALLVANAGIPTTILAMVLFIAIPGALGLWHPALEHQETVASENA